MHGMDGGGGARTMVRSREEYVFGGIGTVARLLRGSFPSFGSVIRGYVLVFFRSENIFGTRSRSSFCHCRGNESRDTKMGSENR